MTFEQLELDDDLCRALADMGLSRPTTIQSMVVPQAMEGKIDESSFAIKGGNG